MCEYLEKYNIKIFKFNLFMKLWKNASNKKNMWNKKTNLKSKKIVCANYDFIKKIKNKSYVFKTWLLWKDS